MVFSQYRETYEVLRDYPKLEGGNIKYYARMAIIETTRSEPIFDIPTRIETIQEPNVTSDPDPPPSD